MRASSLTAHTVPVRLSRTPIQKPVLATGSVSVPVALRNRTRTVCAASVWFWPGKKPYDVDPVKPVALTSTKPFRALTAPWSAS